jgi:hypothetical protein
MSTLAFSVFVNLRRLPAIMDRARRVMCAHEAFFVMQGEAA